MTGSSNDRGRERAAARAPSALLGALSATAIALAALGGLGASSTGCTGTIGEGSGSTSNDPNGPAATIASHSRFPRLSHRQWENTVQDLFYLSAPTGLSQSFYPDALGGKAFDNNESQLQVTPELWSDYEKAAEEVATLVTSDPAKLAKILPANLPTDPAAKKAAFLQTFGARAFRRPLTAAELTTYGAIFDAGPANDPQNADPFAASVRYAIEAMLQSPSFLYRGELSSTVSADGLIHLGPYEVATKLSYTLWNTMPDDELFAAAQSGQLSTKEGIKARLQGMLDDPRSRATLVSFHHQLYDIDDYVHLVDKDPALYPGWDKAAVADMQKEVDLYVASIVVDGGGGLKELLTSSSTFVNARLAKIYGLDPSGRTDTDFQPASLDPSQRPGLFTRSGFLAWKGTAAGPDTIMRGVFLNRKVLCQALGDPPPAAAGAKLGAEKTDRQRVEALTGKGTCGESCHGTYIDPIGYAFETFDAIGQWRTQDAGEPIDASSTFPFDGTPQSFQGIADMTSLVASSEQANRCYAKYWLEYAYGRDSQAKDQKLIDALATISKNGGSTRQIVLELLSSDSFLTRTTEVLP